MLSPCGVAISVLLTANNSSPCHGIAMGKEDLHAEVVVSYFRGRVKVMVIVRGPLNRVIFLVMKEVSVSMGPLRGQVISWEVSQGNMWAKFINNGTVKVRAQRDVCG